MAVETEFKFLLKDIPNYIKNNSNKYEITQIYFNGSNKLIELKELFPNVDIASIYTFRLRYLKNKGINKNIVTLKTKGKISRLEFEKEIDDEQAKILINNNIISIIMKNRYKYNYNDYCFEFDEFLNLKNELFTCEVEIHNGHIKEDYEKIINIFSTKFNLEFQDVTSDYRYKNSNLIKYFG